MDAPRQRRKAQIGTSCCSRPSLPRGLASGRRTAPSRAPPWLTTLRQTFRNPGERLIRTFLAEGKGRRTTRPARDIAVRLSRRRFVAGVQRGEALRNRRADATARLGGRRPGGRRLGALPARGRAGVRARPLPVPGGAGAAGVRHGVGPGQCRRPRHPVADAAGDDHRRPSSGWPSDLDAPRSSSSRRSSREPTPNSTARR